MASQQTMDYSFCLTSDLDLLVRFKICSLEGLRPPPSIQELLNDPHLRHTSVNRQFSDVYLSCQLFADSKPLTIPVRTSYRPFSSHWTWNEWIVLPIKYRDLVVSAQLAITVWDIYSPRKAIPIGGTTFPLFGKHSTLKKGKHKLFAWPNVEADGRVNTSTPSNIGETTEMDRLEKVMRKYERGDIPKVDWLDHLAFREIEKINKKETSSSKKLFLFIELPQFDFSLVFNEKEYTLPAPVVMPPPDAQIVTISDPETYRNDNPVENKHRKLVRSHRNGPLDGELKPNSKIRDELNTILGYPPTQNLNVEEKDLLWKFRFYLTKDKKALTKFVKSVEWSDSIEEKQALDLLAAWVDIDVEDALELLGPAFENKGVRKHAILQLHSADDEELHLYLLQLVQALKFEGIGEKTQIPESPLAEFLIERATRNYILGNQFYWYLMVEMEDKNFGRMYGKVVYQYMTRMMEIPDGIHRRDALRRQAELIASLATISKEIRAMRDTRAKRIERLRAYISDPKNGLLSFAPMPLPLDAHVQITGIIVEKATVLKSALMPLRLNFTCLDGSEYRVMFKVGDDMRQDQLVVQIITLIDKLLRKENLDLKLTPYKVIATSIDQGMVEFIPSHALALLLAENNNSILQFFRSHNPPDPSAPMSIPPQVMDTYIKSCAGYCVITYLLGVGDRHLDNLLLTTAGHLFHVDFGFILGRDPKPFPPPMKLCKEMVEAMGGATAQHYQKFKSYCYVAFNSLRKSANLILNLFSLMVSATIPDIAIEPDKAVLKVQEKFRLDLSDEEAIQYFQALINESVSALFPQVMERIHQWAQYWRR
ncbi:kinase-like domain-containing protein [Cladochytrium replicatum]|nr:kinase-like domain-containing protein [Cladochytrium replicatum]